ncbi:MAG: helix-turn-helix transcriptional regulator [Kineosporiaceae bacterium]|nr:helix-turn-helix transcriptional regulator [Kineosporiaceae bacterium]
MPQPPRALNPAASPLAAFGAAVRERRVAARLSQRQLGGVIHVSGALIGKLEKAERRPDADLVRGLDLALEAGGTLWAAYSRLLEATPPCPRDHEHAAAPSGRLSGLGYRDLVGLRPATRILPAEELPRAVASAWANYQASAFAKVCEQAPALLASARSAVEAPGTLTPVEAWRLLALAHHVAAAALAKRGEQTLAALSAEQGLRAATACGDAHTIAALHRCIAHTVLAGTDDDAAIDLVDKAATELNAHAPDTNDPRTLSLLGSLWLVGALAAARTGSQHEADTFLCQAERLAERLGQDANHCWTWFGPTNTALHRVSVAVELGRIDEAARLAATISTTGLPRERRIRHLLERARIAHLGQRLHDAADELLDAERQAPLHVRRHFITRDLTRSWCHSPQLTRRADVRQLISRMARDATALSGGSRVGSASVDRPSSPLPGSEA